jgi:hypothetical protein
MSGRLGRGREVLGERVTNTNNSEQALLRHFEVEHLGPSLRIGQEGTRGESLRPARP